MLNCDLNAVTQFFLLPSFSSVFLVTSFIPSSRSLTCNRRTSTQPSLYIFVFCLSILFCAFVCRLNRGVFLNYMYTLVFGLSEGLVQSRLPLNTEWALKTGFTIRNEPEGHMANSLYILAGLEKLPTVSPDRVDFRAGKVTFKAPHLPSGQKSRQVNSLLCWKLSPVGG